MVVWSGGEDETDLEPLQRERPLRLLVADDSQRDTQRVIEALRESGFDADYLRVDCPLALQAALDDAAWDVVIVDDQMPQFSPDATLDALRERELDLPVILVSDRVADASAAAAMKAGINDYVGRDSLSRLGPAVDRELREVDNRRGYRLVAAELERIASRDSLTGLANRQQLEAELAAVCHAIGDVGHAFLYLDVDQFRLLNEHCGHHAGDELICRLASVLEGVVHADQTLARVGPDQFAVLMRHCPASRAWRIAEQMRRSVNGYRFTWDGCAHQIGISIGIVPIDEPGLDVPEILRRADLACHTSKQRGRNGLRLYAEEDTEVVRRRGAMQWVARLQQALDEDELVLFAQPIGCVKNPTQRPHAELLVRLQEHDGRLTEPSLFIPAAEQFELMPALDRWVIEHACRCISLAEGRTGRWFINLSGDSLSDETLPDYVGERLMHYGVDGRAICFEITETAAIANMNVALKFMTHVRELGCAVALDDFGSGLSSFNYLKSLPADFLKIDGAFVRAMTHDPLDHTIVDAITRIGHAARTEVVGESVEDRATLHALQRLGVDYAQGYAIASPTRLQP